MLSKKLKRLRRHKKIRTRIHGTKDRPRLCVFRSLSHIYAQLIDDDIAEILVSAFDKEIKIEKNEKMSSKVLTAFMVGKLIAKKAEAQKIKRVVFDRGGIVFHGRVKALADGAREGGLEF